MKAINNFHIATIIYVCIFLFYTLFWLLMVTENEISLGWHLKQKIIHKEYGKGVIVWEDEKYISVLYFKQSKYIVHKKEDVEFKEFASCLTFKINYNENN